MQVWWKKKLKTCNDFFIFLVGKETPDASLVEEKIKNMQ